MARRLLLFLLAIVGYCSSGFAQTLGFTIAEGRKRVQIPIEVFNNLVVVPVVLNGALPLKFVIDSGVRTSILTEKAFGDILKLHYSRKYVLSGPGTEQTVEAYVAPNVSIQLPGVIGRGHALLVLENDYLELRNYLGTDVHGVLGYELFSRFVVDVNYQRKLLILTVPDHFHPKKRFQAIDMAVDDTKPYVMGQIIQRDHKPHQVKLLVDSGASHGMILLPNADSSIQIPDKTINSIIGRGLGGEITGKVGRISSFRLGSFKLQNLIVYYPDANNYFDSLRTVSTFRSGSIGGDLLSRFHVIFDYSHQKLYLHKAGSFKKGFYYNLSGITIKAIGARLAVFQIKDVRKGSAAETAGIKEGDELEAINGIGAGTLTLNEISGILDSHPHKKITMDLKRGNTHLKASFRLTDQI